MFKRWLDEQCEEMRIWLRGCRDDDSGDSSCSEEYAYRQRRENEEEVGLSCGPSHQPFL